VGDYTPGLDFPRREFMERMKKDRFSRNSHELNLTSDIPQYFTMTGQSGFFAHDNSVISPNARVGEPCLIRVLNAGMMSHSLHLHANHFYILAVDGKVQGAPDPEDAAMTPGPIWVDTFNVERFGAIGWRFDMLFPFMRPPDVPNTRGIGRGGCPDASLSTLAGGTTWPPLEEFEQAFGKTIPVRQSPLCYPLHDHSEPTQTLQGGNYSCGMMGGIFFTGDLNVALPTSPNPYLGGNLPPQTFPMDMDHAMMVFRTDGALVYGMDEARVNGIMESSRDQGLETQIDRPPFPPI